MSLTIRAALALVALFVFADVSLAQSGQAVPKFTGIGAGIGIGLAIIGAGLGIGIIGFSALASIARQPEQSGTIRGAMILLAALVEGAALIGAVLCFVMGFIGT